MDANLKTYLIIAGAAFLCGLIILVLRSPGTLKKIVFSAATGLLALAAVDLSSALTGIYLAVSVASVGVAVLLGLPGVVSLLFLKLLWHI